MPTCKLWLENNTPTQAAADLDDPSAAANDQAGAGGEARAALGAATLTWLARALASEAEDREEEDEEAEEVPVVPLLEDQANALLDQKFQVIIFPCWEQSFSVYYSFKSKLLFVDLTILRRKAASTDYFVR